MSKLWYTEGARKKPEETTMAGRKQTYPVRLACEEQERLERVIASRKSSQSEAQRARILLVCDEHGEWSDERVAREIGCAAGTVRKWRRRWYETKSIKEAARPGRPRVFSP
jgi:hypothetical protein